MAILQREPIKNISVEDRDFLIGVIKQELPYTAKDSVNWLKSLMVEVPQKTRDLILDKINFEGSKQQVGLEVFWTLLGAGGTANGRPWIGFFLSRLANSLSDEGERNRIAGLFERYVLDEEPQQPLPLHSEVVPNLEAVVGEDTRRPFRLIQRYARAGGAVVLIDAPGGRGTGFLITDTLVMTCNHVMARDTSQVARADVLPGTLVKFNFQQEIDSERIPESVVATVDLNGPFYAAKAPLDFCVFALDVNSKAEALKHLPYDVTPLPLARTASVQLRDRMVIIQHPGGDPKVISYMNNFVQFVNSELIQYSTTTDKGSSGAPVLNEQGEVVAVHNKGGDLIVPGYPDHKFLRNEGTTIQAILDDLKANAPGIYQQIPT